ncbi:hypothetical protein PCANC_08172, partial [Puccinia coronata f. sp. avenae]
MNIVRVPEKVQAATDEEIKQLIIAQSLRRYNQEPKSLQVETVTNLLRGLLNPLDTLGDNQVEEKVAAGFTASNMTKVNFTFQACTKIQDGTYNFVYLSPEIFLDNQAFSDSCDNLLQIYGAQSITPNDQMVPSLIYSGTRVRTLQVLEVLDQAGETLNKHKDPQNTFARRFHACTGDDDKTDVINDFAAGKFTSVAAIPLLCVKWLDDAGKTVAR